MPTTLLRPGGTSFVGHSITVPSARRARLRSPPAAIATALVSSGGGLVTPAGTSHPQLATAPLLNSATPCQVPAATATTLYTPGGTCVVGQPQEITVPL